MQIKFEKMSINDSNDFYWWRNDEDTRWNSYRTHFITQEEHNQWLYDSMKNPLRDIYVIYIDDEREYVNPGFKKVGFVRFDMNLKDNFAEISIFLNPALRNKGYGVEIIKTMSKFYLEHKKLAYIKAVMKCFNIQAVLAFHSAGYKYLGKSVLWNLSYYEMKYSK